MDITGKLVQLLPNVEGESARGHWIRGGFVIETDGEYPRKVAFTAFGEERVAMVQNLPLNSMVRVMFTPESREFQGRWYTDLRCTRVEQFVAGQMPNMAQGYTWSGTQPTPPMPQAQPTQQPPAQTGGFASMPADSNDDLPF